MTNAIVGHDPAGPVQRADPAAREAFIRANTQLLPVPHAPSLQLHLAHEALALWMKTEEELSAIGLPPPFWAFAWAGGQALARYILDEPQIVAGKSVLDFGAGSGLVAIAAARSGASRVVAADTDPYAAIAIGLNAAANGVSVEIETRDCLGESCTGFEVILAGDVCYERAMAEAVLAWLALCAEKGALVLIGDPGRSYFPRSGLMKLAEFEVPVTRDLEDSEIKRTAVWRLPPSVHL